MESSIYDSTLGRVLRWARYSSFWYISVGGGCCADEPLHTVGCRYDLERFGCVPQSEPRQVDLLIVNGVITYKAAPYLRAFYDQMLAPKYVMSIGSCANCGGPFSSDISYSVVPGINKIIPVDVYVPGCPPRPEAIMNGLLSLQEKIRGHHRTEKKIN